MRVELSSVSLSCVAALVLFADAVTSQTCGPLLASIDFESPERSGDIVPYTEDLVLADWAPFTYLEGFFDDPRTCPFDGKDCNVATNKRAELQREADGNLALELQYPEGCIGPSECGMQAKHFLPFTAPQESVTLTYRFKFGSGFEWVRGGKLPGLCGGTCTTGCQVAGVTGWSARQAWRPCTWPPVSELDTTECIGGKLASYVYAAPAPGTEEPGCGVDIDFADASFERQYTIPRGGGTSVTADYFQPETGVWYTLWSHVRMNTAGPPGQPANYEFDGANEVWIEGPGTGGVKQVVNEQNRAWRHFNDVVIDQLYLSTFFGGSSASFAAIRDETIQFDDFKVWGGRCTPGSEPDSSELYETPATWPGLVSDPNAPSDLTVELPFQSLFKGGGCTRLAVTNNAPDSCSDYSIEVNVRPGWGDLYGRHSAPRVAGATVVSEDAATGYTLLKPAQVNCSPLEPGAPNDCINVCIYNTKKTTDNVDELRRNVIVVAKCD